MALLVEYDLKAVLFEWFKTGFLGHGEVCFGGGKFEIVLFRIWTARGAKCYLILTNWESDRVSIRALFTWKRNPVLLNATDKQANKAAKCSFKLLKREWYVKFNLKTRRTKPDRCVSEMFPTFGICEDK